MTIPKTPLQILSYLVVVAVLFGIRCVVAESTALQDDEVQTVESEKWTVVERQRLSEIREKLENNVAELEGLRMLEEPSSEEIEELERINDELYRMLVRMLEESKGN